MNRRYIDRYLMRAMAAPLLATLAVSMLLLVLDQMLRLLDFIVKEGGPADLVWSMLANQLPEYFSLGLPIGLFFGVLFAFRRLSLSSELTAMLATGVSYRRLLVPIYALTAVMAALTFLTVSYLEPYGQYRYAQIRFAIVTGAVEVRMRAGEFLDLPDGAILGAVGGQRGRTLRNVFVETCDEEGRCEAMAAAQGRLSLDPAGEVQLNLFDGDILPDPRSGVSGALDFDDWSLPFDLPQFRLRGIDEREATALELYRFLSAPGAQNDANYDSWRAALHWRVAHSLSLFALPMLGIAMGVANRRRDSGVGPVLGVVAFVVYNELLEASERGIAAGASPYQTIWPLVGGFFVINLALFLLVAERPGGRVLDPVERLWRRIKRPLRPYLRRMKNLRAGRGV